MQIVIDIPDFTYDLVKEYVEEGIFDYNGINATLHKSVANGTPLPKGHGRLIDADKEIAGLKEMKVVDEEDKQSVRFAILEFEYAKPIIEADKEQEE